MVLKQAMAEHGHWRTNQMTLKNQIRSYHSTRGRGYDFNTMDIRGVTWFETSMAIRDVKWFKTSYGRTFW